MSRSKVITTCDCGCLAKGEPWELERWFTLTQQPERTRTEEPKLGREGSSDDLHFATISCLKRWVTGAQKIIPEMMRSAAGLHPRGGFYSKDFPTLWF
jgi:hypothetical protein